MNKAIIIAEQKQDYNYNYIISKKDGHKGSFTRLHLDCFHQGSSGWSIVGWKHALSKLL